MSKIKQRRYTHITLLMSIIAFIFTAIILITILGKTFNTQKSNTVMYSAQKAYDQYMTDHSSEIDSENYYLYEADATHIVTLHNGKATNVYPDFNQAISSLLGDNAYTTFISPTKNSQLKLCTTDNPFAGKKLSVLGDSISTFYGISNNTGFNSTLIPDSKYVCYGKPNSNHPYGVGLHDMWWQQIIDALDMELCVINSVNGGTLFYNKDAARQGAYKYRCVNLHNDYTNEQPDVIAIYLGTNDLSGSINNKCEIGKATDIDWDALTSGTFTPTTISEGYALMLYKISQQYPNASIYCCTVIIRNKFNNESIEQINNEIKQIATKFDATIVDLYTDSGMVLSDLGDGTHPMPCGMDKISDTFIRAMLGENAEPYDITWNLDGVFSDVSDTKIMGGDRLLLNLSTDEETVPNVSIIMNDIDVTSEYYMDGIINIPSVTGDITISAKK